MLDKFIWMQRPSDSDSDTEYTISKEGLVRKQIINGIPIFHIRDWPINGFRPWQDDMVPVTKWNKLKNLEYITPIDWPEK